jgi:hypothetical protein
MATPVGLNSIGITTHPGDVRPKKIILSYFISGILMSFMSFYYDTTILGWAHGEQEEDLRRTDLCSLLWKGVHRARRSSEE